ncbi:MAG: hypothetical protein H6923_05060 [Alphaproteobacteria bacterium]|nr:hypothetical protein [Alphaproteobacteria bacterium]
MYFSGETVVAAMAALVSIVFAVLSMISSRSQFRAQFRLEWTKRVLDWGDRAVAEMSRAYEVVKARPPDAPAEVMESMAILAGLVDQGRMFFKNDESSGIGKEKPSAYRGHRPKVLDYIVAAYDALARFEPGLGSEAAGAITAELWENKRHFVSQLRDEIRIDWLHKAAGYSRPAAGTGRGAAA